MNAGAYNKIPMALMIANKVLMSLINAPSNTPKAAASNALNTSTPASRYGWFPNAWFKNRTNTPTRMLTRNPNKRYFAYELKLGLKNLTNSG